MDVLLSMLEGRQALRGVVWVIDDSRGDILPGAPEVQGSMSRVSVGPGDRVTGISPPVPAYYWYGNTVG